jgi:hypothetical protein
MSSIQRKIIDPTSTLIEQTAADLCAVFYEAGLSAGLKSKHKTHKAFVHHNLEHFIPKAVELLVDILGNPATPDSQKQAISEALIERANDPDLMVLNEPIQPFKETVNRPIIVNSSSISSLFDRKNHV